jgi:tRNA A37 threonylcarbamoyladenosine dehydratase
VDTKKIIAAFVLVFWNVIVFSLNAPIDDLEEDAKNSLLETTSEILYVDEDSEWSNCPTGSPVLNILTAIADLVAIGYIVKPLLNEKLYC